MFPVGVVVLTLAYAVTYIGVERFRGDKRSVALMVMGRDAPDWSSRTGGPVILAN